VGRHGRHDVRGPGGQQRLAQGASNGIRRIRNGTVSTIGSGYQNVFGITGDPQGDWIYFIERDRHRIIKLRKDERDRHRIIKLRKDGSEGAVLAGGPGAGDGIGTGASILFNTPTGLSYGDGNLYVADLGNGKVKKLTNINATPVATLAATVPNATGVDYGIIQGRPILGVTSGSTGQVYVVDPLTARTASIRTLSTGIFGIAVNEGRLVITNPSTDQITVLRVRPDHGAAGAEWQQPLRTGQLGARVCISQRRRVHRWLESSLLRSAFGQQGQWQQLPGGR